MCLVTSLTLILHELEIGQLHTRWQVHSKTVLIKKFIGFTVTAYILQAQYELLTNVVIHYNILINKF